MNGIKTTSYYVCIYKRQSKYAYQKFSFIIRTILYFNSRSHADKEVFEDLLLVCKDLYSLGMYKALSENIKQAYTNASTVTNLIKELKFIPEGTAKDF